MENLQHFHPTVRAAALSLVPNAESSLEGVSNTFIPPGAPTTPVENPNWLEHVRFFFTKRDFGCMAHRFDLSNYNHVKRNVYQIWGITNSDVMPERTDQSGTQIRWAPVMKENFKTWMLNGCPYSGNNVPNIPVPPPSAIPEAGTGVRKDINSLNPQEIADLKKAFQGMMDTPIKDPFSYYSLASAHGLPEPYYCWHHFSGFLTWHRAYSAKFEEAMQKIVPGIRLPYWNISKGDPPAVLWEPPFDKYTYPTNFQVRIGTDNNNQPIYLLRGPQYENTPDGLSSKTTVRVSRETMMEGTPFGSTKVTLAYIHDLTANAMKNGKTFEDFAQWADGVGNAVEKAHDSSHLICGSNNGDMTYPDITAFDPIFWFTHAEYDRLFWIWQKVHGATTVEGIRQLMTGSDKAAQLTKARLLAEAATLQSKSLADVTLTEWVVPWVTYADEEKTIPTSGFTLTSMIDIRNLQTLHHDPVTGHNLWTTFTSYDYDSDDWGQVVESISPQLHFPSHGLAVGPGRRLTAPDEPVLALFSLSKLAHYRMNGPFTAFLTATRRGTDEKQIVDSVHVFNRASATCVKCQSNPLDISFGVHPFSTNFEYSAEFESVQGHEINPLGFGFPKLEIKLVN